MENLYLSNHRRELKHRDKVRDSCNISIWGCPAEVQVGNGFYYLSIPTHDLYEILSERRFGHNYMKIEFDMSDKNSMSKSNVGGGISTSYAWKDLKEFKDGVNKSGFDYSYCGEEFEFYLESKEIKYNTYSVFKKKGMVLCSSTRRW